MSSHQSIPARKSGFLRYAIALALMVAIVGGIAWLAQHQRKGNNVKQLTDTKVPANLKLVEFPIAIAEWSNQKKAGDATEKDGPAVKAVETGKKGYYDFLFKNTAGQDIEVMYFTSDCSCTDVEAGQVDGSAWERLNEQRELHPAEPIAYTEDPAWQHLPKKPAWDNLSTAEQKKMLLVIKAGAGGVVRVHWNVNKSPGQALKVRPGVAFRLAADPDRAGLQQLVVPVVVALPVRFLPTRIDVGTLQSGRTVRERFYAFSSTRDEFDLKLTPLPDDGLVEVAIKPLRVGGIFSRSEIGDLEWALRMEAAPNAKDPSERVAKAKAMSKRALPVVRAACLVTVTVHESHAGKQLDLGSFYRRLEVTLDGFPHHDLPAPEIVGRVFGVVDIGGVNDQRKVHFQGFSAQDGAVKNVELLTNANVVLETSTHKPEWINVELTRSPMQPDPKRISWNLKVTVPPNTPGVRTFEEGDAVVLRVVGTPERFVRIPIEGDVSGK